jgi:hypothetical protein
MREGVQGGDRAHGKQVGKSVESADDQRFHESPLLVRNQSTEIFSNPLESER